MYLEFNDFIEYCERVSKNDVDWIELYYHVIEENDDDKNDIFMMAAMIDNQPDIKSKCLEKFDWGFSPDSFGKATFYQYGGKDGEIYFSAGSNYEEFGNVYEYLIALRTFYGNYNQAIDINPELIWYGNLVKTEDGYIDSITKEIKIKQYDNKVQVLREYLKDFLAAKGKLCIIGYDNRRFIRTTDKVEKCCKKEKSQNYNYSLVIEKDNFSTYDFYSCILGKIIIEPYQEPLHEDYQYFIPQKEEYSEFIIGMDKSNGKDIIFTCNEDKLSNYFGKNQGAPHFLTPVFFTRDVLDRYTGNPEQYKVADDHIMYLNIWSLPYTINKDDKVTVWLGDLGRIPHKEQQYWKVFNIRPQGEINDKFIRRQLHAEWTDSIGEEKRLFSLINKLNEVTSKKFGEELFNKLSLGDIQLESAFIIPSNTSLTQYQNYLIQLNKLTIERINTKLFSKVIDQEKLKKEDGGKFGSRIQFSIFMKELGFSNADKFDEILKLITECRNKLAGHSASIPQYNKLWGRKEDERIETIKDARFLLSNLNKNLEILIQEIGE